MLCSIVFIKKIKDVQKKGFVIMAGNNEFKYSKTEAMTWAKYIIQNDATLVQASNHFKIPPATIWRYIKNMTPKSIACLVSQTLDKHRKDSTNKAITTKWANYYTNQSK